MDIRAIAQSGGRISKAQLAQVSGLSERAIRTAVSLGIVSKACGKTRSAYYTHHHILEADAVRATLQKGLPMTSLIKEGREDTMPPERGKARGRVYRVTENLMLVEVGPQAPLDIEIRKMLVRLAWRHSKRL